jgi:predicted transcriptional regulator YdeE
MEYKVVEKGPMQIMGIEMRTSNEHSLKEITPFWEHFYRENIQALIPNQKTGEVLGLYCEYEKDHTQPYTLVAGCEVTLVGDIPKGLVVKKIPAAKYAVFEITGKFPEELLKAWQWIWEGHLQRTYAGDLEIYQLGFDGIENTDIHLYVAIY